MKSKLIEIRDRGTRIDVLATKMVSDDPLDNAYLNRNGYSEDNGLVIVTRLEGGKSNYNPYKWDGSNTMLEAHRYINENYDNIPNHWVVDVETILGAKSIMKVPERYRSISILFRLKSSISLSDSCGVTKILREDYKLNIVSSYLDVDTKVVSDTPELFYEISKDSIIESGIKFYEVLNHYVDLIY